MDANSTTNKKNKKKPFSPLDDCDRPACDDIITKFMAAKTAMEEGGGSGEKPNAKNTPKQQENKVECPPSSAELGTGTWTLLHSMVRVIDRAIDSP